MLPEEKARVKIDKQLRNVGWCIVSRNEYLPNSTVAVKEALMVGNTESDYLLFIDGKAIAVVEAKREENPLGDDVKKQAEDYAVSPQSWYALWFEKLIPLVYMANGNKIYFKNMLVEDSEYEELSQMHSPKKMLQMVGKKSEYGALPLLEKRGLRDCQYNAEIKFEESLKLGNKKNLAVLATGSGKTYLACLASYRLLNYTSTKRILFLVDRNNLARQTETEFSLFDRTENQMRMGDLYTINRLKKETDIKSDIVISTIQKLFAVLTGQDIQEGNEDAEDEIAKNDEEKDNNEVVELGDDLKLPPDYFQLIIVDECHRSIYNVWSQVLSYFDAFIVGLTATPDNRTFAFFDENIVSEYPREQAIVDGVNVGEDIFLIETNVGKNGGHLMKQLIEYRDRLSRAKRWKQLDEDIHYQPTQLDRDIVNPSQIRTVIKAYKENLYTKLFSRRKEVPKTLIFAKTDSHADDIVQIVREEFGEGNDFCRKITYSVDNSESVLSSFRNDYNPRIAVTVDMIATGTDVKPIECLIFMRDVRSKNYFEQMKGRGTRTLSKDELQKVTPSATENKDHFVIVDAVGVTKSRKSDTRPLESKPSVSMKELMMNVALGAKDEKILTSLANRVIRLNSQMTPAERKQFEEKVGTPAGTVAERLLNAFDEDVIEKRAQFKTSVEEPDEEERKEAQKELIKQAVAPFHNPDVREYIENVRRNHDQIIDNVNIDSVIFAGFDTQQEETAERVIKTFHEFIEENKDEIVALRIIYDETYKNRPMAIEQLKALYEKLKSKGITVERLWDCYAIKKSDKVKRGTIAQLTDLISIIRFEMGYIDNLTPFADKVNYNFMQWTLRRNAGAIHFTEEQMEWLRLIKDHIATSLSILPEDLDLTPFDRKGGLLGFYDAFGDSYEEILQEMNEELVA